MKKLKIHKTLKSLAYFFQKISKWNWQKSKVIKDMNNTVKLHVFFCAQ